MQKVYQKIEGIKLYPPINIKIIFDSSSKCDIVLIPKYNTRNNTIYNIAIIPHAKNLVKNDNSSRLVISSKEFIKISIPSFSTSFDITIFKTIIPTTINTAKEAQVIREHTNPVKNPLNFSTLKINLNTIGDAIVNTINIKPIIKGAMSIFINKFIYIYYSIKKIKLLKINKK